MYSSFNRTLYYLILGVIGLPLLTGLLGVVLPSFGYDPALGQVSFHLGHWQQLLQQPEFWSGLRLSLSTGVLATLLSYWFASSLIMVCFEKPWFTRLQSAITPILSIPHASITIGALFLLAPSGWLVRLISPWLSGFERPPNWITVQDPEGVALIIALVIKEMPYLMFAMGAALSQLQPQQTLQAARLLGYERLTAWHFTLLPQLFPLLRLPIFMVLAFNMTVVDVASIIGPNTPSTLAVTLLRWFNDPNLVLRGQASAAALVLASMVAVSILCWLLFYRLLNQLRHHFSTLGTRQSWLRYWTWFGASAAGLTLLMTLLSLLLLPIWAFTKRWRFPDAWPNRWTLDNLNRAGDRLISLTAESFSLAIASAFIGLLMALVLIEFERAKGRSRISVALLFSAVLLPQVTLLFGIQVGLLYFDWSGTWLSVLAVHVLYTLPYIYLTLKAPYLAFEQGYLEQANRLRFTPIRNYLTIKLALLKAPLAAALAIGFAVSMAQYLPTLLAGEGRINTLTTEAVARASSGDRKLVSVLAFAQAILPLICFMLATLIPRYWTRWRLAFRRSLCSN
ncbi:Inner membrane ABC transporter permease protein YnjC [Marinomonas aquimarina]|uniref:Inner membrane ABC transporter permease protein YnjC n=1 Tax=Marinomonas aquimarina TaxID=295068 RepID=A0A1A8T4P7_9GAMM|nr:hypothetical protein [Marinomonas aquimarina]SBS27220.1 Inner membrane ABC transporter permease protein YnjC [Marinomonas aquimarina]